MGKEYLTVLSLILGGSPLPCGKATGPAQEEKNNDEMSILLTAVSSCEHVAAVECLFDRRYALKIGQARFIFGINISGINGSTLSSFTGLGSQSE